MEGKAVAGCKIIIDDKDTTIVSDKDDFFRVNLPCEKSSTY